MSRRLLLTISLPALLAVALAFAAPAVAVPPTTEVVTIENFTFVDTALCGFPVAFTENGTFKVTTFYDNEGNPVRSILTNFNERYTSSATANEKTLVTNYPLVIVTSFVDGTRLELGLRNAYTVPGGGVVLLDAGRVVIDLVTGEAVFSGQHQFLEGDADAFCGFFADP